MPCYDPRDEQDRVANQQAAQVLSVLLCANLTRNPSTVLRDMSAHWLRIHHDIDRAAEAYRRHGVTPDRARELRGPLSAAEQEMRQFMMRAHLYLVDHRLLEETR